MVSVSALFLSVVLAQAPVVVSGRALPAPAERVDVAYQELSRGENERAAARLERHRQLEIDDPAKLLNLGAAYARLGRKEEARDLFAAAVMSANRYDLELADGRWMDSRRAARLALQMLKTDQTLALR